MSVRRAVAATMVVAGLLAATPASGATAYSMDGKRNRTTRYSGSVTESAVPAGAAASSEPLAPSVTTCSTRSCDIRELRLALPRRTSWGRFRAVVTLPRELVGTFVLYDSKGEAVTWREIHDAPGFCCEPKYALEIAVKRLKYGRYTLALIDRAGTGTFDVTVEWVAHPPDSTI